MPILSQTSGSRPRDNANIVSLLSLKLILLAFFILLTTMSSFEERRSRDVMESVAKTFRGTVPAVVGMPRPDAGLDILEGAPSLVDRIRGLFKQTIPAVEVKEAADGTTLRVEMPARALFRRDSAELAPARGVLLQRLAAALADTSGGQRFYELQFLHATGLDDQIGRRSLPVLRAGRMARHLGQLGLPREDVSIGLWPVDPNGPKAGLVAIEVRLYNVPVPAGQVPAGQAPGSQAPGSQAPGGQAPGGQSPGGRSPAGGEAQP